MREKYEKFLHFFSISEWDDARFGLDLFDGVSNDEFPISLAVIFTVLKRRNDSQWDWKFVIWNAIKNVERESSIVSFRNWKKMQKLFVFFSHYKFVLYVKIC